MQFLAGKEQETASPRLMPHAPRLSSTHYRSWDRRWGPCEGGPFTLQDPNLGSSKFPTRDTPASDPTCRRTIPRRPAIQQRTVRLCSAPGRPATKSTDWQRCTALRRAGDPDSTRWQLSAPAPLATAAFLPLGPRSTSSLHNPQLGSCPFWSSWFLWVSTQQPGRSPGSGALPPPRRARVPPSFSRALTRSRRPRLPGWLCHPSSGSSHFPLSKDARKDLALQTFPP